MNIDNNSDPNESLEGPEDDDFGDYEGAEDEAPEAVQAMTGGPNWVYPDLVRIQSTCSNTQSNETNNGSCLSGFNNPTNNNGRLSHRILDPPDVSLLTSNLNTIKPQNTLDLCSSLGPTGNKLFNTTNHSNKSCIKTSASSPSSGSSSTSLAATNISGLILSNSSNSSSASLTNQHNNNNNNIKHDTLLCNNINPIPSTSNGMTSGINQHLSQMEQRIRSLQIEKRLLQEQLCERDKQINDLQRIASINNHNENSFEESIGRRIEISLERIESNLETSMNNLTNRVERLENKVNASFSNGIITNNKGESNGQHLTNCQCLQLFQQFKMEQQQERQETRRFLSNVLQHALDELNKEGNLSIP